MSEELKPCPMCGCAATFVKHSEGMPGTQGYDQWDAVACKHCRATVGASDRRFRNRDDAQAAWNRRAPDAQPEPAAPMAVELTRDTLGLCIVKINGREAIRDAGDVISHFATLDWFATPTRAALTDEQIEHVLAQTLDAFAASDRTMTDWRDVRTDIAANSKLRNMFARAVIAADRGGPRNE